MNSFAVDAALLVENPADAAKLARELEDLGYDGVYTFEGRHDPFLPLAFAATSTRHLTLGTGIAVAFARNPMLLANLAYDLQLASRGRFLLGLGSQIRPHIEKRFSMPWSEPAARMRELVQAVRAIWACWQDGEPLAFRGRFYNHTLMTPFFNPGPCAFGLPPVYVAGVGPVMTSVAGEVADGFLVHPFNTPAFVRDDLLPSLHSGESLAGRAEGTVNVSCQIIVATGLNAAERERNLASARGQVAFYASTPAYKPVLERHGMADLQPRLNVLSKEGKWEEMSRLLSDDLVDAVVVTGEPEAAGAAIAARCAGWCARISPVVHGGAPGLHERLLRGIHGA